MNGRHRRRRVFLKRNTTSRAPLARGARSLVAAPGEPLSPASTHRFFVAALASSPPPPCASCPWAASGEAQFRFPSLRRRNEGASSAAKLPSHTEQARLVWQRKDKPVKLRSVRTVSWSLVAVAGASRVLRPEVCGTQPQSLRGTRQWHNSLCPSRQPHGQTGRCTYSRVALVHLASASSMRLECCTPLRLAQIAESAKSRQRQPQLRVSLPLVPLVPLVPRRAPEKQMWKDPLTDWQIVERVVNFVDQSKQASSGCREGERLALKK